MAEENYDEEMHDEADYSDVDKVEKMRESDEIDDTEEAFMRGYDEDAEESSKGEGEEA